ncbi:hypothetical protein FACS1894198_4800 [Clostridia bacterium]|nr:hypothetical protein FACS1894198_4800 [Clostridia bacterium]
MKTFKKKLQKVLCVTLSVTSISLVIVPVSSAVGNDDKQITLQADGLTAVVISKSGAHWQNTDGDAQHFFSCDFAVQ